MSLVLHPQKSFTVVRQITNHLDTDTNYVRAVIRNAYTDALIETLSLTDRGSQRFSSNWRVPADTSGEGFYVSIVTSVYTDSGYTTKNPNYGDEESTYLVEDRVNALRGGGGGADARTIRRIIKEELALGEKEEPEDTPEQVEPIKMPEMRWEDVLSAIAELKIALKPEKPEKVNFEPVYEALQTILSAINDKEVTEPTDLSPILSKLDEKDTSDEVTRQELVEMLTPLKDLIETELPKKIGDMLGKTTFGISLMPTTTAGNVSPSVPLSEPKKEELEPFDISKIAS